MSLRHCFIVWCFLIHTQTGLAEETKDQSTKTDLSKLTLDRIYKDQDFKSESYSVKWLPNQIGYTRLENAENGTGKEIVIHNPTSGAKRTLVSAADLTPPNTSSPLSVAGYQFSDDLSQVLIFTNTKRVWRQNTRGDYWYLDRSSRQLRKLGGDAPASTLMFAKLSPNGRFVAFVRERNIYVEDLLDASIEKLTETANDHVINGTFDWVYEEELGLRDGFRWSPDSKSIAYWQINREGVQRFPMINNTDSTYPKLIWFAYPKVGQRNSECRIGIVNVDSKATNWVPIPGDSREHYLARMEWAPNSGNGEEDATLMIQQLNRRQNTNRVFLANAETAKAILVDRDDAWVDVHDELFHIDATQQFTWISERDGWRHIYLADLKSEHPDQVDLLTPGDYDVIQLLNVDSKNKLAYFLASPDNPTQQYLYQVSLEGGQAKRLTPKDADGSHSYQISSDAKWAIHTYSTFDQAPRVDLVSLPDHQVVRTLIENKELNEKLAKLGLAKTEFLRVDIGDGIEMDGWCMKPPKLDQAKKYPLLVYVYGEPAGQTVLDRWGSRNLWHAMLAQRGYVVMSFDNRGTPAPRGRTWRKCVYKQVGVIAPYDQAKAIKAVLKQRAYIDPDRVGVWGWSGGGSMTLNAMFKFPELYKTGISIAPVPNQRYYDTIYQERYMGLPQDNVQGFLDGSPINFAHQLKGNLLLIHGTGDDNCHYQTSEMLINELVKHNKRFTMMAYPNRSHSIREGKNTTRHLRDLMTWYLEMNLPSGGR